MPTSPDLSDRVFAKAVAFVIDILEGGERPVTDSGGLTRYGIAQKSHPSVNVAAISRADAEAIYRRDYWAALKADLLPPALALLVFAAAVNAGNGQAVRLLQRAVGEVQDGVVGQNTLLAVRRYPPVELRVRFNALWLKAYYDLAREKPFYQQWLDGWTRRVLLAADEAGRWVS
jgi:lysozyme family protein